MSYRRTLSSLIVALLAATVLAVPAAMAMPTDPTGPADASQATPPVKRDLRGEAAAESSRPSVSPQRLPGPPTWPEHPAPINPTQAEPVSTGDGGGSDDFPVVLVAVIGGVLVLCGGAAVTAMHARTGHAH
jgi:hypothetical protein